MMTLQTASGFFNETEVTSVYDSSMFYGQILPFTDSVRSGPSSLRRILEVAPDVEIPRERTVNINGNIYLVASGSEDYFQGDTLRRKFPLVPAANQFFIRTVGQILADTGGVEVYASPTYIRRNIDDNQSAYLGGYDIYFSPYYSALVGTVLVGGGKYFRTREASRIDDIGVSVVETTEATDPLETLVFQAQGTTYNPLTDDHTPPASVPDVACFVENLNFNFDNTDLGFEKIEAGDKSVSLLKSQVATVTPGDNIGAFRVLSVVDLSDAWSLHVRVA